MPTTARQLAKVFSQAAAHKTHKTQLVLVHNAVTGDQEQALACLDDLVVVTVAGNTDPNPLRMPLIDREGNPVLNDDGTPRFKEVW